MDNDLENQLRQALAETIKAWQQAADALAGGHPADVSATMNSMSDAWVQCLFERLTPLLGSKADHGASVTEEDLKRLARAIVENPELVRQYLGFDAPVSEQQTDLHGAQMFCNRAYKMLARERHMEALGLFKKATEIKPDLKPAWSGLALTLKALGDTEGAVWAQAKADQLL